MEILNHIVARYLDGRVIKGTTRDFNAMRPGFHLEVGSSHEVIELRMRQLKAVFFVKSFDGDPARENLSGFITGPEENPQGRKIAVRFRDGEFLCGYTMSWTPEREGFFVFPADSNCNNDRIYVVSASTTEIKAGPMAEALAQRMLAGGAGAGKITPAGGARPLNSGTGLGPRPSPPNPRPRSDAA